MNTLLQQQDDLPPEIDPNKNYLPDLVGEGKKFKTAEELARGKYEADQYIEILKKRSDEMRADYLLMKKEADSRANLDVLIDKLQNLDIKSNTAETLVKEESEPKFDPKQLDSFFSSKLQEHEANRKQEENFNTVKVKLQERFGNNYQKVLSDQMQELGLTEEYTNNLARTAPKAFMKTFGLEQAQGEQFQSPPRGNQRSDSFSPSTPKKRTWSYYQELKKANPQLYYDPKIAVQMHNDAIALGEAFQDGDFRA